MLYLSDDVRWQTTLNLPGGKEVGAGLGLGLTKT